MKLYCGITSPYSRKVRVAAAELGAALELVETNALAETSDFGLVTPVNRVPALLTDAGRLVIDSPVICEYLDAHFGPALLPPSGAERWDVLHLQALGDGLMDAAVPWRYENQRPAVQQSPTRIALYRRSVHQVVAALAKDLGTRGHGQLWSGVNVGTISVACALSYFEFRFPDESWQHEHPALKQWLERFADRASMKATPFAQ
ncbi:glutathione S-transferase family protein [Pseudochelatococcus sp. B33]